MNLPELKSLLEKYYNGESSPEDQERIIELLADSNLPKEYFPDREIFNYLDAGKSIPEPDSTFEGRIMERLDRLDNVRSKSALRRRLYAIGSAAAAVLILITTYLFISVNNPVEDTFDDPMIAYNEARRLLHEVSANLNRGCKEMANLAYLNKAVTSLGTMGEQGKRAGQELSSLKYLERGIEFSGLVGNAKEK